MNGTTEIKDRPPRLRTVSWQEELSENDNDVPGTPKGPRTSTTPGLTFFLLLLLVLFLV